MLEIGKPIPTFEGLNQDGKPINSADFLGKKLVIFSIQKPTLQAVQQRPVI